MLAGTPPAGRRSAREIVLLLPVSQRGPPVRRGLAPYTRLRGIRKTTRRPGPLEPPPIRRFASAL
jgi:hypothetical protein